jgi:G3E family GTPase
MTASLFPALKTDRMPVSLVTGFLGSGKTTLINRLLVHPAMANTAVVVNEFGEVALDQHFIAASDGDVVVLANGCVCCTAQGELDAVIGTLFAKRRSGAPFERLLIETTGLADPAPIVETLLGQPFIAENFALDAVMTTIDAVFGMHNLDAHGEALSQAVLADRLVITKTDLADASAADALALRLRDLNAGARILRVPEGDLSPGDLFGAGLSARDPAAWLGQGARHESHLHGIETFTLSHDEAIEWRAFSSFLTRLKVAHAERLLRVKGIVAIAGEDAMLAIHGVHHVFHPPERLPMARSGPSRIVFITKGHLRDAIAAEWRAAVASP